MSAGATARVGFYSWPPRPEAGKPGGAGLLQPLAPVGRGDPVQVKTLDDALRLLRAWQEHAEEVERECRELRERLAEALGDAKRASDFADGLFPAALAYVESLGQPAARNAGKPT